MNETRFCDRQSSKESNSKRNARVWVMNSAHRQMLIDNFMKFRENSLNGF